MMDLLADVKDWLWDHILPILFGVLTLACLLLAGQYVLTWPVGEALQDAWAQMRHHWKAVLVGAWAVLGGWIFRELFSRILQNYSKGFYDYCGEHRTFIRGLLVVLVALGEIALLLIFWKPVSGFFNTHSWLNSMQLFLLSAPVAYLLWIYRDANKLEEIENERIGQKQADFHKLEEWLASAETDENLKVVAVHQLEPYLRLDAGYPDFFQRPCCGLLLSILEEWGKQQRETPKKAAEETNHVGVEVPATIQAIHALVVRNLAWVCKLKEHHVLDLSFAHLGWARLEGADLTGVHLEGADLGWAQLEGAQLRGANLKWANLEYAQLEGASFKYALLEGTNFNGAHELTVDQFNSSGHLDKARFNADFRAKLVRAYPLLFPHEQVPATEAEDFGPMFETP
jgi:hypothetical protein